MKSRTRTASIRIIGLLFIAGCAQVPKESVELSATVGRDIAELHEVHRETARLLFRQMRDDVNQFVDEVYRPYIISSQMEDQQLRANSSDQRERNTSILLAINAAFGQDANEELQETVLIAMGRFVERINERVEQTRQELLQPISAQEESVINSLDRSYQQVHYANSIVTGHLASIREVHDAQEDILRAIGVQRDLRAEIGDKLSTGSERISEIVRSARVVESGIADAEERVRELKEAVSQLNSRTSNN